MSYKNPTAHEKRIQNKINLASQKVSKTLDRITMGRMNYILICSSHASQTQQGASKESPAIFYTASQSVNDSALLLAQTLLQWQLTGRVGPLQELQDSYGNKLMDVVEDFKAALADVDQDVQARVEAELAEAEQGKSTEIDELEDFGKPKQIEIPL